MDLKCDPGLGSACSQKDECSEPKSVCHNGTCICGTGYYDINGVKVIGGTCTSKVGLGSSCSQADACSDTNALCSNSECTCRSGFYDDNGSSDQGGICQQNSEFHYV
ncbi:hypothetical protein CHS0354_000882 [Potamilus streckersoni]|uniref:EB domain-containing protein n=1 Tax=Potamilus streckersoni TaxID=2493646 RepID=A0AAE0S2C4_9BIVA|nr:hypothetical protein CHS0354_000882 [Potamilus streckersoni]